MQVKRLPIGIENFEEMIRENYYYIDKTGMISELLKSSSKVNLFTRPRRFGKTLNMSMLKSFFEIDTDATLFDGLTIHKEEKICEAHLGKYPVVFLSLKGIDGRTFEDAYALLRKTIRREALRLDFLLNSERLTEIDRQSYVKLLNETESRADIIDSLGMMTHLLQKHYGKKVVLLIDEYDVPLDKAYAHGYYDEMLDVLRGIFGAALKTNDSLYMAVLTGCLRISKESIFTGLNNMKIYSISDVKFDDWFGFTEPEVQEILRDYRIEECHDILKAWYDGYRFGLQDVYCPWDVLNYCDDYMELQSKPKAYWLNTSGNDMVRRLIDAADTGTTQMEIEALTQGRTVTKRLNLALTHSEVDKNIDNIWSLLYMTGYLTAETVLEDGSFVLRIPNREIYEIYATQILEWFKDRARTERDDLQPLFAAFEAGDSQKIKELLNQKLLDTISYMDAYESFYHGFLLALLSVCSSWNVISNRETGQGRSDILVEKKDRTFGCVIEVKHAKMQNALGTACSDALEQIEAKDYTAVLRRYRYKEIRAFGIAFWDKECKVDSKSILTNP